jgi:PPOX class probable F420-dependent enzyme
VTEDLLATALAADNAAWAREHLEGDVVGYLTTVAPDGRVQSSVISFLFDRGGLFFYSQPNTPKMRNLEHSPRISFHLQSDRYGDHWFIVEGEAVVDRSLPALDENAAYVAKYTEPHAHWGMDFENTAKAFTVPIRIVPSRIRVG